MLKRWTIYLVGALAFALTSWACTGLAQPSSAEDGVRAAGDEAKFRVISRFPDRQPAGRGVAGLLDDEPVLPSAIREAIAGERWKVARLLVEKKGDDSDPYHKLLAGYLAHRAGKHAEAFDELEALAGDVDDLEDYRLFWAAQAAFELDKFHEATLRAAKIPRDSQMIGRGLMLMASALIEQGSDEDLERAVQTLDIYLSKYPNGRSAQQARHLLGRAHESAESWAEAAHAYLAVLEHHPLSSDATSAKSSLAALTKRLDSKLKAAVEQPDFAARMHRYRALYASHKSETLVDELSKEINGLADDEARRCEALYLVARSHTKLRRHTDGVDWYERVLDECEDTEYHLKALYVGGRGFWNAGKRDEARAWFGRIWNEYEDHSYADDAMYFAARILRDQEKWEEAAALLRKQVARYPGGDMAKDAHWMLVRRMFEQGDHKAVVDYVDGLDETGEDDLYSRGRLHYFRARALQQIGQSDAATEAYRELIRSHPLSYYALLGFNRLGQMVESDKNGGRGAATDLCTLQGQRLCDFVEASDSPRIGLSEALTEAREFQQGRQLLRMGLTDLAEDEFRALRRSHGSDANLWAITALLDAAGAYPYSHDLARRHIEGWQSHYPESTDAPRWSLAYPRPFERHVANFVQQRGIPAALVYAIMREESGFNPHIESWANARGLLQLMEATAKRVAGKDGMSGFSAERLFEPETNIRLGTAYMKQLADKTNAHPALIIAGYNGGYGNVSNWLDERGDLALDLWVEDIPFGQTRKYTKRVLSSFFVYSWLYGADRVPRISFELPGN